MARGDMDRRSEGEVMPRPRKYERLVCRYFSWTLLSRDEIFWADGRSNPIKVGRHSLGTKSRAEAIEALHRLDLTMAVKHGLAESELLEPTHGMELSLPSRANAVVRCRFIQS